MNVIEVAAYIKNKCMLANSTFVYTPNEAYYVVNGKKISVDEMKKKFPLHLKRKNWKGNGIDSRRICD